MTYVGMFVIKYQLVEECSGSMVSSIVRYFELCHKVLLVTINTPNTLPIINTKSYISWPHWDYRRVKGLGKVELNDIVVFNFPAGDTIMTEPAYQGNDYYYDAYTYGTNFLAQQNRNIRLADMNTLQQRAFFDKAYAMGRDYIVRNVGTYGALDWRPTDRRENYVKRCVGLPGQTLQIKNKIVYVDGKANKEPEKVEYTYFIKFKKHHCF